MKKICIILALLVASCNQPVSNRGADGYQFGDRQYERESVQVKIVTYKTKREFDAALRKYKLPEETVAFTELYPPFDTCTIHMVDPAISYEPEFVGHEFLHCAYGQWHTSNDRRS